MALIKFPRVPHLNSLLAQQHREAMPGGYQVDPDDDRFRRLSAVNRNLDPITQDRMIEFAHWLYMRNPLARRLISIQVEWVLGEGITLSADDDAVREVVMGHWKNGINNWDVKGEMRFQDLRLFGESCYPVRRTAGTGKVILGLIDPSRIDRVQRDPEQQDEADVVILKKDEAQRELKYKVIREDPATGRLIGEDRDPGAKGRTVSLKGEPTRGSVSAFDGECFYFAVNQVAAATRGISDLFALVDYIDGADQFLWSSLERAKIANALVFDVTVEGEDSEVQAEAARVRRENPTKPGTVNVHGKGITWQLLEPKLGATEAAEMSSMMMRWVLGGVGLPEAYFAKGSETNRATIEGQADPVVKRMTSIQRAWLNSLDVILRYSYESAQGTGTKLKDLDVTEERPWKVEAPDISARDLAKITSGVASLSAALTEAVTNKWISTQSARRGWLNFVKLIGIDADPDEEDKLIKGEEEEYGAQPTGLMALLQGGGKPGAPGAKPGAPPFGGAPTGAGKGVPARMAPRG